MKSEVKVTVRYEERGQVYREIWRARLRVPRDMKSEVKVTVRYEERGQGYREIWRARLRVPWDMKSEVKGTVRWRARSRVTRRRNFWETLLEHTINLSLKMAPCVSKHLEKAFLQPADRRIVLSRCASDSGSNPDGNDSDFSTFPRGHYLLRYCITAGYGCLVLHSRLT
jgi:hypothetical protein